MSTSTLSTSNITSGFIDIATFEELEKYMYGSENATNYFVSEHQPSIWFTQVPVVLSRASGNPEFSQDWSVSISRAGDYLLHSWLRMVLPAVEAADGKYVAWTPNVGHAIIKEVSITFNDLSAARFDNYVLDFLSAFSTPAGKIDGYKQMIGMVPELVTPSASLPAKVLNIPLPLFFSRDSGVALPTASLPYNDMRVVFSFRSLGELLTTYTVDGDGGWSAAPAVASDLKSTPSLSTVQVWGNYALVSNDHRRTMGGTPRDIVVEQHQHAPKSSFDAYTRPFGSIDIRFSHSVKALFWAVQNTTIPSVHSNYTTKSAEVEQVGQEIFINYAPGSDPIDTTTLIYENTHRLAALGSDYFSLVQPYYQDGMTIPSETGYHMYSYALNLLDINASGSTNYGKLTNISLVPAASQEAIDANQAGQKFMFMIFCLNNNIIRVSGGALGFPIL
jgi:hypothetical protein